MDFFGVAVAESVQILFQYVDDERKKLVLLLCRPLFHLFQMVAYTVGLGQLTLAMMVG